MGHSDVSTIQRYLYVHETAMTSVVLGLDHTSCATQREGKPICIYNATVMSQVPASREGGAPGREGIS
jgi:hypothetical protein